VPKKMRKFRSRRERFIDEVVEVFVKAKDADTSGVDRRIRFECCTLNILKDGVNCWEGCCESKERPKAARAQALTQS
jgi:hypothetical protein